MRMIAILLAAALLPAAAAATERPSLQDDSYRCLMDGQMTSYLRQAWQEQPKAVGDLSQGNRTTLFVSRAGSWTLVEHRNDGRACVLASGSRISMAVEKGFGPALGY